MCIRCVSHINKSGIYACFSLNLKNEGIFFKTTLSNFQCCPLLSHEVNLLGYNQHYYCLFLKINKPRIKQKKKQFILPAIIFFFWDTFVVCVQKDNLKCVSYSGSDSKTFEDFTLDPHSTHSTAEGRPMISWVTGNINH